MNNKTIVAYAQEISPRIREIEKKKELLKDFIDSDEEAQQNIEYVTEAKNCLKDYLQTHERFIELTDQIKELEKENKEALKAIAGVSNFKPTQWKGFLKARNKDKGVVKVIDKGVLFADMDDTLE